MADEFGKRRVSSWRMTEATVREYAHVYGNAEKIEETLEIRKPLGSTSGFRRSPNTSTPDDSTNAPGSS
jgi:hypothetical protein